MTIVADLHMHTTESDGTGDLETVLDSANQSNLDTIAITDHDTVHSKLSNPIQEINGLTVIRGIELRVRVLEADERIDLLGYGVRKTTALQKMIQSVQKNRKERAEQIITLIEDETGVQMDFTPTNSTGRPHIARAIDSNDELDYTYEESFKELIGNGCPCYVSREIPKFKDAIPFLKDSCEFISLAHPYRYSNTEQVLKQSKYLDGIECNYPYNDDVETDDLANQIVANYGLVKTGGSDAHEPSNIGLSGLNQKELQNFLEASDF